MDIGRLKTLRELAMRGTMAAVSDAISISPSGVSQQISQLEDEVGIQLVERRGRGVAITPAGAVLVKHAERLLTVIEEAKSDLEEMKKVVSGELRVTSFPSIAAALIAPAIREMQLEYPNLVVFADEMEPLVGLASLRSWQADIAIIDDLTLKKDKDRGAFAVFPIYDDRIVAVVHKSHPVATKVKVMLTDLKDEYWAIDTRPNTFSEIIFAMCQAKGFTPKIIGRFDAFDVISSMVVNRCAISVLPQIRTLLHGDELVARQFSPPIKRTVLIAIRKGEERRPSVKIAVEALRKHAQNLPRTNPEDMRAIKFD
ncbi:LysR family transcriptional regulator [Rhizobium rhizogenes]|uniref:LysR family transcriptional regulator n=1 Tax=Rhizobium rhizogenes TaxID=359 RepID=UPI001572CE60|nr:LysR family transcriptional regulator [Rhizobium rhizogenes]NTH22832.1 LysR family transcriptional regulator [Rhizobium rhizogenes]NTH35862.1 LysR family transcriptional regulator [Rhizobium rhizogenes]